MEAGRVTVSWALPVSSSIVPKVNVPKANVPKANGVAATRAATLPRSIRKN
jgi:hypothetical protein